ncbi:outer membrane protein assembly factor BamB family protein [Limnoglobus roseus]|uniref:Alcohol dehydrogenase n=1 Tax=Limnoglobus roseus TaxID=2598579 RepID=A0A5C1AEQ1_9BACT|nr:PQQ-binding-like beta-propeller repeat protein [Limnoglobus roseus]QEL17889.1 alcohol dehydrogenase [Limnoglobus roseus]
MTTTLEPEPKIRLYPALIMVGLAAAAFVFLPIVFPRTPYHFLLGLGGPTIASIGILLWWLRGSRVRGAFRWLPVGLFLVPALANMLVFYRPSMITVLLFGFPLVAFLWVAWLVISRPAPRLVQLAGLLGVIVGGWALFTMVRIDETNAEIEPELDWRWHPTKMESFQQERAKWAAAAPRSDAITVGPGDWAEFRGPKRDDNATGVTIDTDWNTHPPKLLWKHRIGAGWGSFAVVGDKLFTQEQVDEQQEAVTCYTTTTGALVWEYRYPARFYEQIAGVGPRGTPTIVGGRAYTFGGSGKLVCLDAAKGTSVWERDVPADTGAKVQQWGYSSSPLVAQGVVVVFANGPGGKGTAAYKTDTGELAWTAGNGTFGYSSAQLAKLGGVDQILMVSDVGIESYQPADGKVLWVHDWKQRGVNRVSQPAVLSDTDLLIGTGVGTDQGTQRVHVTRDGDTWKTEVVWKSKNLKPYFNDGVVHVGHFYGFDDKSFTCIDLKDGSRKWKTGTQYGHGQVLLLGDQAVLVVQAVDGKIILVAANPDEHTEIAKLQALDGKTWNHPVVAHGNLFVRNNSEVAVYELNLK